MLQKVNGVSLMVMVCSCPDYETIKQAEREDAPISLEVVRYVDCIESYGTFELVNIRNVSGTQDRFQFSGSITGVDIGAHPDNDKVTILFVKSGTAKVVVDSDGVSLFFIMQLSVQ